MNNDAKTGCLILIIGAGIIFVFYLLHVGLGRFITHLVILILAAISVGVFSYILNHDIGSATAELANEKKKLDEAATARDNELARRRKEHEEIIQKAARDKAIRYIASMREAAERLDGTDDNAKKVAIAINGILDNIGMDDEITDDIINTDFIKKEVIRVQKMIENSLLKDKPIFERYTEILL